MEFEWDTAKAASNHTKHSVEFPYATHVFLDEKRIIIEDARVPYGEQRNIVMGMIEGRVMIVTYTMRGNTCHLISARKGNSREQKRYYLLYT